MKTKLTITLAVVLAVNLVALWCLAHRYEFHTGMSGAIIWRCNNFTGKVDYCRFQNGKWVAISNPKPNPFDEFDNERPQAPSQKSWTPPEVLAEEQARTNTTNRDAEQFFSDPLGIESRKSK